MNFLNFRDFQECFGIFYEFNSIYFKLNSLKIFILLHVHVVLTRRNREVVNFTRYHVKNYSKLPNFKKFTRIEGYNGK